MKKILFVLPSLHFGGLERVQVTLANALAARNYSVTILTLNEGNDLLPLLDQRVKYIYKEPREFPIRRKMKYIWTFYDAGVWERRATPRALYKYYVGNEKYDIEIGFFRGLPIKIVSGSTNKHSIKLAWVHSDFLKCAGITNGFKNLEKAIESYKSFNNIVCVSKQAADSFKTKMGITEKLKIIYNINPVIEIIKKSEKKYENPIKKRFNMITVGRLLNSAKGFDRLLEVCKKLNDDGLDYSLTIVGDGPDKESLQKYIKDEQLTNVQLVGMQPNPYKYMKNAELLVCSSYFEGYNLTVAESLIVGTPVLSTNCTGPSEILDNGLYGMIVENNTQSLYEGIKKLIKDKELYSYYKIKTKERIPFFDEERIIKEVESLF